MNGFWIVRLNYLIAVTVLFVIVSSTEILGQRRRVVESQMAKTKPNVSSQSILDNSVNWQDFTTPNKALILQFPAAPRESNDNDRTIFAQYFAYFENTQFGLVLQNMRGGNLSPAFYNSYDDDYETELLKGLRADGWRIVNFELTARNESRMESWFPPAANQTGKFSHSLSRSIVKDGWNYTISCNSIRPGQEVNRKVCNQFLNSARLVSNDNQIGGWYKFTGLNNDFIVQAPAPMRLSRTGAGPRSSIKQYEATTQTGYFSVNFQDLETPLSSPLFNAFEADHERLLAADFEAKG